MPVFLRRSGRRKTLDRVDFPQSADQAQRTRMRDLSSGYALGLGVGSSTTSGGSSGRGIGMGRGGSSQGGGAVGSGGGRGGVPGGWGVPGCWANGAEVSAGNRPILRLLPGPKEHPVPVLCSPVSAQAARQTRASITKKRRQGRPTPQPEGLSRKTNR